MNADICAAIYTALFLVGAAGWALYLVNRSAIKDATRLRNDAIRTATRQADEFTQTYRALREEIARLKEQLQSRLRPPS